MPEHAPNDCASLAKFIVGDEQQILMQANLEEGSAKTYEAIAQRLRKEWGL